MWKKPIDNVWTLSNRSVCSSSSASAARPREHPVRDETEQEIDRTAADADEHPGRRSLFAPASAMMFIARPVAKGMTINPTSDTIRQVAPSAARPRRRPPIIRADETADRVRLQFEGDAHDAPSMSMPGHVDAGQHRTAELRFVDLLIQRTGLQQLLVGAFGDDLARARAGRSGRVR